jgi:hypothetical protein
MREWFLIVLWAAFNGEAKEHESVKVTEDERVGL